MTADFLKVILTADNAILAILVASMAANVGQFIAARVERKEAWQYVDRLTTVLGEMRVLLEVIKATIPKS